MEQFNQNTFTYYRIKLRNSKPEPIVVPISQPLQILMKNIVGSRKKGPVFEKLLPDQTMNRYLKEIATIAGIGIQWRIPYQRAPTGTTRNPILRVTR